MSRSRYLGAASRTPPAEHLSSPSLLRGLLDGASLLSSQRDLESLLEAIGETIAKTIGLGAVVINLYRAAWDDMIVAAVHGSDEAKAFLLGTTETLETWEMLLQERYLHRGAYRIKHDEIDWSRHDMRLYTPEGPVDDDPEAWHPKDALMVPMLATDGRLLGVLSVDEPLSGRHLPDDELDVLVGLARHAALAVEHAQEADDTRRHRRSLERLLRLSVQLTGTFSIERVLGSVCDAISSALGFERVAISLLDERREAFSVKAFSGWTKDDPTVTSSYPRKEMERLLDQDFEVEGCYLIEQAEALRRVGSGVHTHNSTTNGRGPYAWNHHWLIVPLFNPHHELTGLMWVDDPEDRLLPSVERLQALRTFANQAAMALESAERFKAVQRANKTLNTLIDESPLAIVALDRRRTITTWNPAAERIFGWKEEEAIGNLLWSLLGDDARLAPSLDRVFDGAPSGVLEFKGRRKDGVEIEFSSSSAPLRNEEGESTGVVCLLMDITERNQLEEKLRHRQKLESIGMLAGGIAHDFNNLLVGVLGNASLAMDQLAEFSPEREYVEGIQLAAKSAADLTQQMLAYSGQGRVSTQSIDLSGLAHDAMTLLQRVVSKKARFHMDLAKGLPLVEGDASQIRQIAMNLITNASEALCDEQGSITLATGVVEMTLQDLAAARLADGARPGPYVFLEVTDTGCGIDDESLDRIFDPFFSTKFTGRGLGLAAVLGIVRSHRGVIHIGTSQGEGTTFRVCLPPATSATESTSVTLASAPPVVNVGDVLVIDDEEPVRRVVARILEGAGINALMAVDGDEGIEIFREKQETIGVVILDLTMPGTPADRVFKEISQLKPSVRIILSSGYSHRHFGSDFGRPGTSITFLQKPYQRDDLLRVLASPIV